MCQQDLWRLCQEWVWSLAHVTRGLLSEQCEHYYKMAVWMLKWCRSVAHLGNMCPVSFTSLQGIWCFTSGLFIQVWMLTISFLSSSDMDELSISSSQIPEKKTKKLSQCFFSLLVFEALITRSLVLPVSYSSSSPILKTGFTPLYGLPTRSLLLTCLDIKKKHQLTAVFIVTKYCEKS